MECLPCRSDSVPYSLYRKVNSSGSANYLISGMPVYQELVIDNNFQFLCRGAVFFDKTAAASYCSETSKGF
jgi:hypothetical protein